MLTRRTLTADLPHPVMMCGHYKMLSTSPYSDKQIRAAAAEGVLLDQSGNGNHIMTDGRVICSVGFASTLTAAEMERLESVLDNVATEA